jgi:CheY-like chemotaxis protein
VQHTVLIIDDDENDILITKETLSAIRPGITVRGAFSGEEGLALLQSETELPALILLDLKMFGMSGFDTLQCIRADKRLRHLPVVVVTSSLLTSDVTEAYQAGANKVLHKSSRDQIRRDLESVLAEWLT